MGLSQGTTDRVWYRRQVAPQPSNVLLTNWTLTTFDHFYFCIFNRALRFYFGFPFFVGGELKTDPFCLNFSTPTVSMIIQSLKYSSSIQVFMHSEALTRIHSLFIEHADVA